MVDLSAKQQEVLQDETRFAIWELLSKERKAMSPSLLAAQKPFLDLSIASIVYHLRLLVDAGLLELDGALYRAVEL